MVRWGDAVFTHGNAARLCNFGTDLGLGQHTAMAGLGALRELDLDHLDLWRARLLGKALGVKATVCVAAAKIPRGNLPDQVAAVFAVVLLALSQCVRWTHGANPNNNPPAIDGPPGFPRNEQRRG